MATSFFVVSGAVSVLWLLQLVAIMDKHSADKIIICLILIVLSF